MRNRIAVVAPFFIICFKIVFCAYCDQASLPFSGLKKGAIRFYLDGEWFVPSCNEGYRVAQPHGRIVCRNGVWSGHFPPCVVVSCSTPPPPIPHGRVKWYTGTHASSVQYECDPFYTLASESSIRCNFGQWTGSLPVCRDTRCYVAHAVHKSGLAEDKNATLDGQFLEVRCAAGFVPSGARLLCSRGTWIEHGASPCLEANCTVDEVRHGSLMEVDERRVWRWSTFRNERKPTFVKVHKGGTRPPGHQLYVTCESGFENITTVCKHGKWQPQPICPDGSS
ncbi:sushi domain-containing protein [Caerostris darwini]|uniref:Sushi domain-containing protein n=1 Tax=Caerostris darwini TaxID=1538125 RepID=A0AAV4VPT0_9ARAC|nr:sushi domain-containing protein [Caerostris darwini]